MQIRANFIRRALRLALLLVAGGALLPTSALAWWNHDWSYRKQLVIDASPKGADVKTELSDVPVLIRLHEGVFKFADANADGTDLRFVAGDDKTPLKFHIEKYDSIFNLAYVWVQIPKIGAGATVNLWMYYGNAKAVAESDPRETYDANQTLVYHFGERGTPAADATAYHNNAGSSFAVDESGLIGNAAKFDGSSVLALPASPSLAVAAAAPLTWSAWIKPAAPDQDAVLYALHDGRRSLLIGLAKGAPYVSVSDDSGAARQTPPGPPLDINGWHQLALAATPQQLTLYLDGQPGPVLATPLPALGAVATVGGDGGQAGAAVTAGFKGEVDELELSKVARDPTAILLAAHNQGSNDKLIQFGGDEGLSSWSSGYFSIIVKSVTLDAWVVIGILLLMAFTSWVVMYGKGAYIGRVKRSNGLFQGLFKTLRQDLTTLRGANEDQQEQLDESPLHRMYQVGVEEIRHRFELQGHGHSLTAESIEAIRASVDAVSVRENQRLSKGMVLLTIAISGGPFLGLLGTVVGVMITFASIAAAGDVNINAIAPGISAALLATVAGLGVAIPALFGYNYLLTQIKETQANMQVFVDEFVTRMAELYPAEGRERAAAPRRPVAPASAVSRPGELPPGELTLDEV